MRLKISTALAAVLAIITDAELLEIVDFIHQIQDREWRRLMRRKARRHVVTRPRRPR